MNRQKFATWPDDFPIIFYIGRPPFVGVTWSKSHQKNHGINQSKIKAWFPPVKFNGWFTWKNQPLKTWSFQPFISNPPPGPECCSRKKKTESQMQLEAQPYSLMRRSQLNSTRWWGFSPTHLKNMFVKLEHRFSYQDLKVTHTKQTDRKASEWNLKNTLDTWNPNHLLF